MSARGRHATVVGLWRATALIALWALLGLAAIAAVETAAARADTTIRVTTAADENAVDGRCSLAEALDIKAGLNEPDCATLPVSGTATIVVPAGCYRVSAAVPFPELSGTEVIEGAGPEFVFTQRLAGRTVDRRCVARTRRNGQNPVCTRSVIGGTLALSAHAGVNKVHFDGRLPRYHKLSPGAYTLVIVATDTTGRRSAAARLTFTILRRLE